MESLILLTMELLIQMLKINIKEYEDNDDIDVTEGYGKRKLLLLALH